MEPMRTINWTYRHTGFIMHDMVRFLVTSSAWEIGKWCLNALLLLLPGSFVVFVLWWLVRMQLLPGPSAEQYLAEATDLSDLERRMRVLERSSGGPAFVTFNH